MIEWLRSLILSKKARCLSEDYTEIKFFPEIVQPGGCIFGSSSVVLWPMKLYFVYPFQLLSGIIMLLALLWLTMGASFVYVEQQKQVNKINYPQSDTDDCKQASYPFKDNTEEKTETFPNVFADEYLREDVEQFLHKNSPLKHNKCYYADAFVTFYCESFSPPPETIS